MNKKCSKYESLFVFSDEETLKNHLKDCEECQAEQTKMDRVSELLDEVKFYYRSKRKKRAIQFRVACALFLVAFSSLSFGIALNDEDLIDTIRYGKELSAEDLGFPVDAYGLLMVDDEF